MKTAKGVSKNVVKNQLNFIDYVKVVEEGKTMFCKMYVITLKLDTVYTQLKNKPELSARNDKRYFEDCNL